MMLSEDFLWSFLKNDLLRSRKIRLFKDEFVESNVQKARKVNDRGENQARTGRGAHHGVTVVVSGFFASTFLSRCFLLHRP